VRYFAYGANMDPTHLAKYCPGAIALGPAVLPGHRFEIAARGYGHAAPDPGHDVPGFLWELPPDEAEALDRYEGVPEGWYRRDQVTVRHDGMPTQAMLYVATDTAPGLANPGYLEGIVPIAERSGFPEAYVARLRRLQKAGRDGADESG